MSSPKINPAKTGEATQATFEDEKKNPLMPPVLLSVDKLSKKTSELKAATLIKLMLPMKAIMIKIGFWVIARETTASVSIPRIVTATLKLPNLVRICGTKAKMIIVKIEPMV